MSPTLRHNLLLGALALALALTSSACTTTGSGDGDGAGGQAPPLSFPGDSTNSGGGGAGQNSVTGPPGNSDGGGNSANSANEEPDAIPSSVPLSEFGAVAAQVQCEKFYGCSELAETRDQLAEDLGFFDQRSCVDVYTNLLGSMFTGEVEEGIQLGRLTFDPDAAGLCMSSLSMLSCQQFFERTPVEACEVYLTGNQALGDPCRDRTECADEGASCAFEPSAEESVCAPPNDFGGGCTFDSDCAEGLVCAYDGNSRDVCAPAGTSDDACFDTTGCAPSFTCDFESNTCVPLPFEGESCNNACADDLLCHQLRCTSPDDLESCTSTESCPNGQACVNDARGGGRCVEL